tara:strand:+ start:295 stop:495 length:201 start_codon:yes stop_codon:yes gene_type:complete
MTHEMIIVKTCKEEVKKTTVLVLDKIDAFQREEDAINIFSGGNIFYVCENLDGVWSKLVKHFGGSI